MNFHPFAQLWQTLKQHLHSLRHHHHHRHRKIQHQKFTEGHPKKSGAFLETRVEENKMEKKKTFLAAMKKGIFGEQTLVKGLCPKKIPINLYICEII